jgi:SAM-dependent methyltransferase
MTSANADQIDYWNDQAGQTWAEMQPLLDMQIGPYGARAIEALSPVASEHILDIGCGCGDSTLEIARRVAPGGSAVGVDISAPMLAVARHRAAATGAGARFEQIDAQTHHFEPVFDAAFSRFGIMFFADPAAAFTNIRSALRPGGRLAFVCWQEPVENPWLRVPLEAAIQYLPPQPPADPNEPGPFAFADPHRVHGILDSAGFGNVAILPYQIPIGGFPLEQALTLALRVGPLGRLLRESPGQRPRAIDAVRAALAKHETPQGVFLQSATWIVTAEK